MYHKPVFLNECIDGLAIKPDGIYVDVTFGGGGHAAKILEKLSTGKLIAFDQDEDALANSFQDSRFLLIRKNFRYLKNYLKLHKAIPVDGILADLGISSHQIDTPERGFSIRFNGPLDLRMDNTKETTAANLLNEYSERELRNLFFEYGEIKNSSKLARTIVEYRSQTPIKTIEQFKEVIASCIERGKENKYLAKVFQALRMVVNEEITVLKEMLLQTEHALKPGGRLVIISYHSLEDRLVKNYMKSGNFSGEIKKDFYGNPLVPFKMITRKAKLPDEVELTENPRSRSAKLRIAEKL